MIVLRDYQEKISDDACDIIEQHGFVYLAMQVRTGKTLTALSTVKKRGCKSVLFVTKKKAIDSIRDDYMKFDCSFAIDIVNYESVHKFSVHQYDMVILDEAHGMGAFPKPSGRAVSVRNILYKNKFPEVIFLSGTPSPESYAQLYHQFWVLGAMSPFARYQNFYKWAHDYVSVTQRRIGSMMVNDYSNALKERVEQATKPYMISFTQDEAGFKSHIDEEILIAKAPKSIVDIAKILKRDSVVEGREEVILADTGAKMMQKLHQIYSGTVKFESGNSMVLDTYKADFIANKFKDNKIGIFYKFVEELNALKKVFGDCLTTELKEFDEGGYQVIALQIVSGREGISLKNAEYLIFYNIDFSATSYWQARDRMTTKDRGYNKVYWVFSDCGIEQDIYKVVNNKKNYTLSHFKKDLLSL
jgi:hypothetical protein